MPHEPDVAVSIAGYALPWRGPTAQRAAGGEDALADALAGIKRGPGGIRCRQ
jgi:hypothetical protein